MSPPKLEILEADLVRATKAAEELLDELQLESYLFEVEPREGSWRVKIELATRDGAWQQLEIAVAPVLLIASLDDRDVRRWLLKQWGERLSSGKRTGESGYTAT